MMTRLLPLAVLVTGLLSFCTARAGPLEDGFIAYAHGDYTEALKWFQVAAAQGSAKAQLGIAVMYDNGIGVVRNYAEAARWYQRAAIQGNADAQEYLAEIYYKGQGVPQNYSDAVKWFRLAAAQGNPPALFNLGVSYASGHGVPKDYVRAHMWFNLCGALGQAKGVQNRDTIATLMTPEQIAEAQDMAQACQQRSYKGCD